MRVNLKVIAALQKRLFSRFTEACAYFECLVAKKVNRLESLGLDVAQTKRLVPTSNKQLN
jgi:hypothetical protein